MLFLYLAAGLLLLELGFLLYCAVEEWPFHGLFMEKATTRC
jgi:hypothetical protein